VAQCCHLQNCSSLKNLVSIPKMSTRFVNLKKAYDHIPYTCLSIESDEWSKIGENYALIEVLQGVLPLQPSSEEKHVWQWTKSIFRKYFNCGLEICFIVTLTMQNIFSLMVPNQCNKLCVGVGDKTFCCSVAMCALCLSSTILFWTPKFQLKVNITLLECLEKKFYKKLFHNNNIFGDIGEPPDTEAVFFGYRTKFFWNDWKTLRHFG